MWEAVLYMFTSKQISQSDVKDYTCRLEIWAGNNVLIFGQKSESVSSESCPQDEEGGRACDIGCGSCAWAAPMTKGAGDLRLLARMGLWKDTSEAIYG